MGVRDEARIIRGMSSCGLPCCCSYWLNQFAPIGIKMVKEQNIALNPAKISGICGRLMCCMAFEHKVYKSLWAGLPGPGSKIKAPLGNYIVLSMDVAREAVRCHKPSGGEISVPIASFQEFRQAVMNGEEWAPPLIEEPEDSERVGRVSLGERGCGSCRRNMEYHGAGLNAAGAGSEPLSPRRSAVQGDGGDAERVSANRRRGKRGGRRHRTETGTVALRSAEGGVERIPPRPRVADEPARPVRAAVSTGETGEAPRVERVRHRRRRPRRGPSPTQGLEG
jgi:hypothetical protein